MALKGEPETAAIRGSAAPGFESVRAAFARNVAERDELGAAFAAYVDGVLVVDLWGGTADAGEGVPWCADTLAPIFSGTKGLTATCMLKLIEMGALDLETPVCRYWPEFAAEGKEHILVCHVVSHQAGMPGLLTPVTVEEATDGVRMAALLAAQRPIAAAGSRVLYHAVTFGWLCGELVRRVDGRSVGRFLREEIAEPLGLETWIGLPQELEPRVATIEPAPGFGRDVVVAREQDEAARSVWANPPRFAHGRLAANLRAWHAGEVPATNGIASARSLARLYGCLACGGELDGVRVLEPGTIERGRRPLARGHDPYLDAPIAFATGFQLQTREPGFGPAPDAFGHAGAGGSVHGAWPSLQTGFSYLPNRLARLDAADARAEDLLHALHTAAAARGSADASR